MKEFEINAIAIKENTGDYTIRHLFTYDNFMTIEECYKHLYIILNWIRAINSNKK